MPEVVPRKEVFGSFGDPNPPLKNMERFFPLPTQALIHGLTPFFPSVSYRCYYLLFVERARLSQAVLSVSRDQRRKALFFCDTSPAILFSEFLLQKAGSLLFLLRFYEAPTDSASPKSSAFRVTQYLFRSAK